MDKALLQLLQQSLDVLTMAVNQNQHDMLMTGEECRKCESAIEALQAAIAKPRVTHITWNAAGVRTVNGVPDYVARPVQPAVDNAAFEVWAKKEGLNIQRAESRYEGAIPRTRFGLCPATYYFDEAECAWRAWANKPIAQTEQPALQPLTDEQIAILRFLYGAAPLDGCWFGDVPANRRAAFWWRKNLGAAFAAHIKTEKD